MCSTPPEDTSNSEDEGMGVRPEEMGVGLEVVGVGLEGRTDEEEETREMPRDGLGNGKDDIDGEKEEATDGVEIEITGKELGILDDIFGGSTVAEADTVALVDVGRENGDKSGGIVPSGIVELVIPVENEDTYGSKDTSPSPDPSSREKTPPTIS